MLMAFSIHEPHRGMGGRKNNKKHAAAAGGERAWYCAREKNGRPPAPQAALRTPQPPQLTAAEQRAAVADQAARNIRRLVAYETPPDLEKNTAELAALEERNDGAEIAAYVLARCRGARADATGAISAGATPAVAYAAAAFAHHGETKTLRGTQGPKAAAVAAGSTSLRSVNFKPIFALKRRVVLLETAVASFAAVHDDLIAKRPPHRFLGCTYGAWWVVLRLAHLLDVCIFVGRECTWVDVLTRIGVSSTCRVECGLVARRDKKGERNAEKCDALARLQDAAHGAPSPRALMSTVNFQRMIQGRRPLGALDLSISECLG